jgi:hypothetical protein
VSAFVKFQQIVLESTDSVTQLQERANRLIKGCDEHFRSNLTQVSRISAVIPVDLRAVFVEMVVDLHTATTSREFIAKCNDVIKKFPRCEPWLRWWMQPDHAMMLFKAERKMSRTLWLVLPSTTNAGETQHSRIYQAIGNDFNLVDGLRHLCYWFIYLEQLSIAAQGKV